jgi:hypothetical protein
VAQPGDLQRCGGAGRCRAAVGGVDGRVLHACAWVFV